MRRSMLWRRAASGGAVVTALLAGCVPFPGQSSSPLPVGDNLLAEPIVRDAATPSALAPAPDGRVFYAERHTGRIRVVVDDVLKDQPFAQVPVNTAGDRGLLGIALHPKFETNPRVYAFYSRSDSGATTNIPEAIIDHRVVYFIASDDVASGSEIFVASIPSGSTTARVGGRIAFDADGKLLVGVGDGGDDATAQDPATPRGKILRFNDDGSIPAENPLSGSPLFALGVRDVGGLCVDSNGGGVFVVDRNPPNDDEIDRVVANSNLGWPSVAGKASSDAERQFAADNPAYLDPLIDSGGDETAFAGISFNPSGRYGESMRHSLLYGDSRRRRVYRAELNGDRTGVQKVREFASGFPSAITDVVFTPAGTLYVACDDAIYRVVPER